MTISAPSLTRTGPAPNTASGTAFGFDDPDFFDHAPIGIFTSTPEGRFLAVNPAMAKMYGYKTPGELLESIRDIAVQAYVDPAEREEFKRALEQNGQVLNYESRRLRRDGRAFWVSVNARIVRDETGGIAFYQGFTTDITKAKLDHQKLRESENRTKALLNALPDLMFLLNREGVFLDYHAPGGGLLMKPDLFLGRGVMDVLDPDIAELTLRHIDEVARTGACASYGYEAEIDAETRYFESRMTSCGANFLAIVRDVTEKKQLEFIRKEQQEQLIQASKMTALGTLVAGVAHEINNPNNLIMLNAPILERSWKDASPILDEYWRKTPNLKLAGIPFDEMRLHVPELFDGISEGSRRIAKIIAELKDFARQSPLNMTCQVNINEVVGSALVLIGKTISRYTDDFRVTFASRMPLIQGDHQKLEQVVVNLLLNACQALTDKKQAVTLETYHVPDRKAVAVRIRDQGEGIRPEDMNRILDPFFSTRHKIGGTGLGLPISSAIVQDHGGALQIDSHPGQGTTITVHLGNVLE